MVTWVEQINDDPEFTSEQFDQALNPRYAVELADHIEATLEPNEFGGESSLYIDNLRASVETTNGFAHHRHLITSQHDAFTKDCNDPQDETVYIFIDMQEPCLGLIF